MATAFVPRGDCREAERKRVWSPTCPRCQEVAGAGVCPAPDALAAFAMLFNRTFVLCFGKATCPRHRSGYWPRELHDRMTVFDGRDLDRVLGFRVGPSVSALLGIGAAGPYTKKREAKLARANPTTALNSLKIVRHRVLALLASLKVVDYAQSQGLPNILVLEGDVRPVPRNGLSASDVGGLRSWLARNSWQVVRPSGYFWDFADNRGKEKATSCPAQCRCTRTGLERACLVRRAPRDDSAPRCDVRDTVGFAVHSRAYPAFRRQRRLALDALVQMASAAEKEVAAGSSASSTSASPEEYQLALDTRLNASFGWAQERFDVAIPWFDKWLPARFDNLYVVPSIAVQQIRQGDERTSKAFKAACDAT